MPDLKENEIGDVKSFVKLSDTQMEIPIETVAKTISLSEAKFYLANARQQLVNLKSREAEILANIAKGEELVAQAESLGLKEDSGPSNFSMSFAAIDRLIKGL
jgi:hypothetical protein